MKRAIGILVVFFFLVSVCGMSYAEQDKKQALKAEVEKVETEINRLYQIMLNNKAHKVRHEEIRQIILGHRRRVETLEEQFAALGVEKQKEIITAKNEFVLRGGLGGGAFMLGINYLYHIKGNFSLSPGIGYGMGNQLGIIKGELEGIFKYGQGFAGIDLTYANYSENVTDVPGLSGATLSKGARTGIGIVAGVPIGIFQARAGLNTALGLILDANFSF